MLGALSGTSGSDSAPSRTAYDTDDADGGFDVHRDFLDPIARNDFALVDALIAPECLLLLPGLRPITGAALVKRVLRAVRRRYASLTFETLLQFRSADDMFVANSKVHGERMDGGAYSNEAITLIRLDRLGRVALVSDYYKDTSYSEPLGRRPEPKHA